MRNPVAAFKRSVHKLLTICRQTEKRDFHQLIKTSRCIYLRTDGRVMWGRVRESMIMSKIVAVVNRALL